MDPLLVVAADSESELLTRVGRSPQVANTADASCVSLKSIVKTVLKLCTRAVWRVVSIDMLKFYSPGVNARGSGAIIMIMARAGVAL
jgi:hypothetical protein